MTAREERTTALRYASYEARFGWTDEAWKALLRRDALWRDQLQVPGGMTPPTIRLRYKKVS
jgi:hypothetical protein